MWVSLPFRLISVLLLAVVLITCVRTLLIWVRVSESLCLTWVSLPCVVCALLFCGCLGLGLGVDVGTVKHRLILFGRRRICLLAKV